MTLLKALGLMNFEEVVYNRVIIKFLNEMVEKKVIDKVVGVEESYNDLGTGEILPETDGYRAVLDAMEIGEMKVESFLRTFVQSNGDINIFNPINLNTVELGWKNIEDKKKEMLEKNKNNVEYVNIFGKVCDWIERDYWDDGIKCGTKVGFLEKKFEIKNEKVGSTKRFNLREFLGIR
jgi:hypothetical protein